RLALSGGYYDGLLRLWDLVSGECLRVLSRGPRSNSAGAEETVPVKVTGYLVTGESLEALALTPDGRAALATAWDGSLRLWDVARGECVRTVFTSAAAGVALLPGGPLAATASYDQAVRIWDL